MKLANEEHSVLNDDPRAATQNQEKIKALATKAAAATSNLLIHSSREYKASQQRITEQRKHLWQVTGELLVPVANLKKKVLNRRAQLDKDAGRAQSLDQFICRRPDGDAGEKMNSARITQLRLLAATKGFCVIATSSHLFGGTPHGEAGLPCMENGPNRASGSGRGDDSNYLTSTQTCVGMPLHFGTCLTLKTLPKPVSISTKGSSSASRLGLGTTTTDVKPKKRKRYGNRKPLGIKCSARASLGVLCRAQADATSLKTGRSEELIAADCETHRKPRRLLLSRARSPYCAVELKLALLPIRAIPSPYKADGRL
ncbi:hypothetical protein BDZ89DRAFT_1040494 [Hymenopellis radicata]|nr:hypothetical protein BDZ89DRAFT_1040494 [Hymenopellis radicata]